MDPFKKTRPKPATGGGFIRDFRFKDNMALPMQVLRPPENLFPEGFPTVSRHWVIVGTKPSGDDKYAPPMICTQGHEKTGGNCLVCYGKAAGSVNADRGRAEAGEDIIVPVYEHTRYRKAGQGYEPLNPSIPLDDAAKKNSFEGGFKVIYTSTAQYNKIRVAHTNAQNICKACGVQMLTNSLNCSDCDAEQFNTQQLSTFTNEEYEALVYDEFTCSICNHEGPLSEKKFCSSDTCSGTEPKTLYDLVVFGQKQQVPTSGTNDDGTPRTKIEYSFPVAQGFKLKALDEEETQQFMQRLHDQVNNVPTIEAQKKILQIHPPTEWQTGPSTSAQNSQPYGG